MHMHTSNWQQVGLHLEREESVKLIMVDHFFHEAVKKCEARRPLIIVTRLEHRFDHSNSKVIRSHLLLP